MKLKFMIDCKETARLLSDNLEYPLPLYKRAFLRMHLTMCGACALYGKQIKALKNLVTKRLETGKDSFHPSGSSLSDNARERMKLLLKKKNS